MTAQFQAIDAKRWLATLDAIESAALWEELELQIDLGSLDRIQRDLQCFKFRIDQARAS